jgi:GNAT superfamily N-acetyltransferase
MEIRGARPEDAEELAQIWLEFGRHYAALDPEEFRVPAEEGLARWIETRTTRTENSAVKRLVAVIDGHVAGFAVGSIIEPTNDAGRQLLADLGRRRLGIDAIATAERFRRRGIATALMKELEQWGREQGAEVVLAETYAQSPLSIPFWENRMAYERRSVRFVKRL